MNSEIDKDSHLTTENERRNKSEKLTAGIIISFPVVFIARIIAAITFLCIWILILPVWIFLLFREIIGYSSRAALHVFRGGDIPNLGNLDKIAALYPRGFILFINILFGTLKDTGHEYPRPSVFRLIFDTICAFLAIVIIFNSELIINSIIFTSEFWKDRLGSDYVFINDFISSIGGLIKSDGPSNLR